MKEPENEELLEDGPDYVDYKSTRSLLGSFIGLIELIIVYCK
jgi:hypothetical protein